MKPRDAVTVDFPGATGVKRRPAIVISSDIYHANRPDIVLCVLTSNVARATGPTGYVLQDWAAAGLRVPSAMRSYLAMATPSDVRRIGALTDRDWQGARQALACALDLKT